METKNPEERKAIENSKNLPSNVSPTFALQAKESNPKSSKSSKKRPKREEETNQTKKKRKSPSSKRDPSREAKKTKPGSECGYSNSEIADDSHTYQGSQDLMLDPRGDSRKISEELVLPLVREMSQEDLYKFCTKIDFPSFYSVGMRRTGKSFITRNLLYLLRAFIPYAIVFSETAFQNFFQKFIPRKYVINGYSDAILNSINARQGALRNWAESTFKDPKKECPINFRMVEIYDDLITNPDFKWSTMVKKSYVMGRHFWKFVMINSQVAKGMFPEVRDNTDYVFVMFQDKLPQLEALWEDYGSCLPKKVWFKLVRQYARLIKDENGELIKSYALFIDNTECDVNKKFWVFSAIDPGPFVFGCKEFWESECPPAWRKMNSFTVAKGMPDPFSKDFQQLQQSKQLISK